MTPQDLFEHLSALNISVERHSHAPLMTVQDSQSLRGTILGHHSKNLFLKDKKKKLWLVVCHEDLKIDLKALRFRIGAAGLSFASSDLLQDVLGVQPGSVTPFAIVHDVECLVQVVLDINFAKSEQVNFHPLTNTQTLTISGPDLLKFLDHHDHNPILIDFSKQPS